MLEVPQKLSDEAEQRQGLLTPTKGETQAPQNLRAVKALRGDKITPTHFKDAAAEGEGWAPSEGVRPGDGKLAALQEDPGPHET